jgi:predicted Fe-Mo cluster-binding NifX family protein
MKIAISATGPTLDAEVDPRFGRCQYFIIADPETMEYESLENSSAMAGGGAGISTAQTIAGHGVQTVLTGNCGPNAFQVLSAAGIQVITGVSGKVKDAIQTYKSGGFQSSSQANVGDHFGMGGGGGASMGTDTGLGMGGGIGRGMGRGMGGCGGRGRGMGMGIGMGMGAGMTSTANPEQELQVLREQSQTLTRQLAEIERRIEELEDKMK